MRAAETRAGDRRRRVVVTGVGCVTPLGLDGESSALEALFCVRALETGGLPHTSNLDRPDPECQLDHVGNKAREVEARVVLSNSFGFGGTNASLVFARGIES